MIHIAPNVLNQLYADARVTFPDECCGFLFGRETGGGDRHISDILIVDNSKEGDKRRRFEVSPRDYLRAERYAAAHDLELLGVYHSHPNHPAIPSEHDRVAAQPFFSYVIVSVRDGEIAELTSWRLDDDQQFEPEIVAGVGTPVQL